LTAPLFSVVVPVLDGGVTFERCLAALAASDFRDYELLVVDDGSRDGSAEAARRHASAVLATEGRAGPAAARNLGARRARGKYLFFLDADCEVLPTTLARAAAAFGADPGLTALFGSYDDAPAAPGLVARYRNLLHHWVHQQGSEEASTFWAGCGVVRRDVFLELGGFDARRYARPSIEDIELGYRLVAAGHRIRLDKALQVKHHKAWRLVDVLRTDIRDRALPWTRLLLERGRLGGDLNVDRTGRASAALAWLLAGTGIGAIVEPRLGWVAAGAALALLVVNRAFYRFLRARHGGWFAVRAVALHWLYYLYSAAAFAWGALAHLARRLRGAAAGGG
jgi:glycosyltransferase involved in cell wall biosynthesis